MEIIIFSVGLLLIAIVTILIVIYAKDIQTHEDENSMNDEIANYIENDNTGTKVLEYSKHFKTGDGYKSSYKGWR